MGGVFLVRRRQTVNSLFKHYIDSLDPSFKGLMSMDPFKIPTLPANMPERGIYLFSERTRHLYAGRSNRLRNRLQEHSRPSADNNSAPFAFHASPEPR